MKRLAFLAPVLLTFSLGMAHGDSTEITYSGHAEKACCKKNAAEKKACCKKHGTSDAKACCKKSEKASDKACCKKGGHADSGHEECHGHEGHDHGDSASHSH